MIAIAAFDSNGRGRIEPTLVNVEGSVRFGNFRMEIVDLSIPLAGIPISVSRIYDTFNAQDEGDFGFGWTLGVQDARILEAGAIAQGGGLNIAADKFIPDETKVYLTSPEWSAHCFTYKERLASAGFFGATFTPYFEPDPGGLRNADD